MTGVDRDMPSLRVANECEQLFRTGARFINDEINEITINSIISKASYQDRNLDFTIWLGSFNWVAKSLGDKRLKELLKTISEKSTLLVADSAIGGKGDNALKAIGINSNKSFADYILKNTTYTQAMSLGRYDDWYDRELYYFI